QVADALMHVPCVFLLLMADCSAVYLLTALVGRQGPASLRVGVEELAQEGRCEVAAEGNPYHRRIATFPTGGDINALADAENRAQVDARIRRLEVWIAGLRAIVVSIQLQLQAQSIPRRLVLHTTENGRRPAEVGRRIEV